MRAHEGMRVTLPLAMLGSYAFIPEEAPLPAARLPEAGP
jgi:hypothetical protein